MTSSSNCTGRCSALVIALEGATEWQRKVPSDANSSGVCPESVTVVCHEQWQW
ncbi:hypothetical protein L195_g007550 [Trifolium pratense]|uniref:Uncharacterized protein n=1 Tax=Trifolium pratense TaxID=57577 RepID=A0A2K3P6N9_TRIPR|nr:hypothetical protein L195_g007550 [Trifolium pratense]